LRNVDHVLLWSTFSLALAAASPAPPFTLGAALIASCVFQCHTDVVEGTLGLHEHNTRGVRILVGKQRSIVDAACAILTRHFHALRRHLNHHLLGGIGPHMSRSC
jgi:hypothetical protein